jgi:hypothetical protein
LPSLNCVHFELDQTERDNPVFPYSVLALESRGHFCFSPASPKELVELVFTERYIAGQRPGPLLTSALPPQFDAFIRSIVPAR